MRLQLDDRRVWRFGSYPSVPQPARGNPSARAHRNAHDPRRQRLVDRRDVWLHQNGGIYLSCNSHRYGMWFVSCTSLCMLATISPSLCWRSHLGVIAPD